MNALHKWMEGTGTNQTVLAAKLKTSRSVLNRWLQGHKRPNIDSLRKLAKVTGLSLEALSKDL